MLSYICYVKFVTLNLLRYVTLNSITLRYVKFHYVTLIPLVEKTSIKFR